MGEHNVFTAGILGKFDTFVTLGTLLAAPLKSTLDELGCPVFLQSGTICGQAEGVAR